MRISSLYIFIKNHPLKTSPPNKHTRNNLIDISLEYLFPCRKYTNITSNISRTMPWRATSIFSEQISYDFVFFFCFDTMKRSFPFYIFQLNKSVNIYQDKTGNNSNKYFPFSMFLCASITTNKTAISSFHGEIKVHTHYIS